MERCWNELPQHYANDDAQEDPESQIAFKDVHDDS
jgi:hypothetical protein